MKTAKVLTSKWDGVGEYGHRNEMAISLRQIICVVHILSLCVLYLLCVLEEQTVQEGRPGLATLFHPIHDQLYEASTPTSI